MVCQIVSPEGLDLCTGMLSFVYTFTTAFARTVSVFVCIVCVLVLHFNPTGKICKNDMASFNFDDFG